MISTCSRLHHPGSIARGITRARKPDSRSSYLLLVDRTLHVESHQPLERKRRHLHIARFSGREKELDSRIESEALHQPILMVDMSPKRTDAVGRKKLIERATLPEEGTRSFIYDESESSVE